MTNHRPSILIVDDTPENIALMASVLGSSYQTRAATSGERALSIAFSENPPDLILLDITMPAMDGYEVCRQLKQNPKTADVPVIFVTSRSEQEDEQTGLDAGAVDYVTKPIRPGIVAARVRTHLQLKGARDFLRDKSEYLEKEVARRTREISMIQDVTMVAMGSLAETRDNETGNHIRRTQHYVKVLAVELKEHSRFAGYLSAETADLIYKSAPLHDIGKVGIPDSILLKPGKLTPEEFEIMKTHTTLGRDSIIAAEKLIDSSTSFLRIAREIAWSHHEKWDGTGYPSGLAGEDIPVPGRLMAVADVYDALISRRVYKPAIPHEKAVAMIQEGSGNHFDPDVVRAFLRVSGHLDKVAMKYMKSEER